ncbi:hypothetical protein ACIQWZ_09930 [Streptomyces sp. NPDC098077]|uniref:hypothetical protein n=1 Tax=Streptomyces sp. NPDC098077 TaxID=3366093 RepID=UPI0037FACD99
MTGWSAPGSPPTASDKVRLGRGVLDRIGESVPPGANLAALAAGYTPAVLTDATLRRRSA